ncbi:MAG TPA: lipid-A-disaccharide synthase [Gammaproteobacteria bacterium]|nr:lipid-A-disaccharide synthase [Gammaproteobacteria bacterium]
MARTLRIALVAGEASGDTLAAGLMEALRARCPGVVFEGVAGPAMRSAGCRVLGRAEQLSVMGLTEVLARLPGLLALRRRLRRHFLRQPPDVFVGVDAPDFNLALEQSLRHAGIPVAHWVSPSVWAWRSHRARRIRRAVDRMLTLFPFEQDWYRDRHIPACCTGHPFADEIPDHCPPAPARAALGLHTAQRQVALLPGSRRAEVERLLPVFLRAARQLHDVHGDLGFLLPAATAALEHRCRHWIERLAPDLPVRVLAGRARELMQASDVVLLASGTAALECMLIGRPMLVAYRISPLSYLLVRRMLTGETVSLPNRLLGRPQVPEYLQREATPERLARGLSALLEDPGRARAQVAPFAALHRDLRRNAGARAAEAVLELAGHG